MVPVIFALGLAALFVGAGLCARFATELNTSELSPPLGSVVCPQPTPVVTATIDNPATIKFRLYFNALHLSYRNSRTL